MWKPSFVAEYSNLSSPVSGNVRPEPSCDPALSSFDLARCKFMTQNFALKWWKTELLLHALSAMKAPVDLACIRCPVDSPARAGYSPTHHKVWICGNLIWNPFELRRVLTHELVHAFDFARAEIDPANAQHVACTEVRAWNLAGECELWVKWFDYLGSDPLSLNLHSAKQRCIRAGAMASMEANSTIRDDAGAAIDAVWDKCFKDHWPFSTQPELDTSWRDSPMRGVHRKD